MLLKTSTHLRRIFFSVFFVLLGLQLALLGAGLLYQSIASANDRQRFPPPGRLIEMGGYHLHIYCIGKRSEGKPTVIFEGGLGASWLVWALVQPKVAEQTRACSYDRAGYGWSSPSSQPRTARQMVDELHTLLQKADEPGPYILVGHSLGGVMARMYVATYPEQAAGLLLVDARHEDFFTRMPPEYLQIDQTNLRNAQFLKIITPFGITRLAGQAGRLDAYRKYLTPLPDQIEAAAWALMMYNPEHWVVSVAERQASPESYAQVRKSALPAHLRLIVLTAENGIDAWKLPGVTISAEARTTWLALQQDLAKLSSNSQWIIVPGSGHYIHLDQPQAVAKAILSMLQ